MLEDVVSAVKSRGLTEKAIIISFDMEHLKAVYELEPSIELWYLVDEITPENIAQAKALGGKVWLSANFEKNTAESISLAMRFNQYNSQEKHHFSSDFHAAYVCQVYWHIHPLQRFEQQQCLQPDR